MKHNKCVISVCVTLFSPLPPAAEGAGTAAVGLTAETTQDTEAMTEGDVRKTRQGVESLLSVTSDLVGAWQTG